MHIASDSPPTAVRFLEAAEATICSLREAPRRGARFRSSSLELKNLRWVPVRGFTNHLVFYRVHDDHVRIVRVLHGYRDLPSVVEG